MIDVVKSAHATHTLIADDTWVVVVPEVTLRDFPGVRNSKIRGKAYKGDRFKVTATRNGFLQISHQGELKWALSGRGTKANLVRAGAELGEYNRKMAQEAAAQASPPIRPLLLTP